MWSYQSTTPSLHFPMGEKSSISRGCSKWSSCIQPAKTIQAKVTQSVPGRPSLLRRLNYYRHDPSFSPKAMLSSYYYPAAANVFPVISWATHAKLRVRNPRQSSIIVIMNYELPTCRRPSTEYKELSLRLKLQWIDIHTYRPSLRYTSLCKVCASAFKASCFRSVPICFEGLHRVY